MNETKVESVIGFSSCQLGTATDMVRASSLTSSSLKSGG